MSKLIKKTDKKFQMLFQEEELHIIKQEAAKRKLTTSEYIRFCIKNDLTKKTPYSKIMALNLLKNLN